MRPTSSSSLSGSEPSLYEPPDLEKLEKYHASDEDDFYDHSTHHSSTRSSFSESRPLAHHRLPPHHYADHEPILRIPSSRGKPRTHRNCSLCLCLPALCTRFCTRRNSPRILTLTLLSTIVIMMLALTQLSRLSNQRVRSGGGAVQKPRPPIWEEFPFLKRYHGGVKALVGREDWVKEYPGPGKRNWTEEMGEILPPSVKFDAYASVDRVEKCFLDKESKIAIPSVRVYNGVPQGMPENVMGSYDVLGLNENVCFERFGRLGPYGLGYSRKYGGSGAALEGHTEGSETVWEEAGYVDYRKVNWAEAQANCFRLNAHRFAPAEKVAEEHLYQYMGEKLAEEGNELAEDPGAESSNSTLSNSSQRKRTTSKHLPRTAVLIRTWHNYVYDDEDLFYLRALISELSLLSGGEFTVHFLIHVKDNTLPIWANSKTYDKVLKESLPAEFQGMGTLWSEKQMSVIYSGLHDNLFRNLPVHGVYRGTFMPVAYFAHRHPEYTSFWNVEMDIRYTGHFYHLLTKTAQWAAKQPRKGLWERNARFYVPDEHGSWEDFSHMVRVQTEHGTASKSNLWSGLASNPQVPDFVKEQLAPKAEKAVWGPEPPLDDELDTTTDVQPPTSMVDDKNTWGVGEEADLMTFNPIFDPQGTTWILAEDVTGYNTTSGLPPRRTSIVNFVRLSRRLLEQMHVEMSLGRKAMFSEMFPASVALHHGLKAVYIPHPVFIDRRWPTDYLAATFNGGRNGQSGGSRLSVFSDDNQHNFKGTTWYYDSGFAPNLWKRWLGYKVDNDGGEAQEMAGEGRMCLPAMLLHPVKQVDLVYDETVKDEREGKA